MIIEKAIIQYLSEALDVDVYGEVPEIPPDEYVLVEKTGGMENLIRDAMVAVQSVSKVSLLRASELNEDVLSAMLVFADSGNQVYSCYLNSDYNFTNTQTKEYRYQAVFNLTY